MLSCAILLHIMFATPALGDTADQYAKREHLSILKESKRKESGWKTVENITYGFRLSVPANSRIEGHSGDNAYEYIRIQNYHEGDCEGELLLLPNKFWLEIHISDHKQKGKLERSCASYLINPTVSKRNGVKIYRGEVYNESGDSGGYMRGLCAEATDFDVYIVTTENNKATPLLKKILGSFKFTR